jgi:hypothetical protein
MTANDGDLYELEFGIEVSTLYHEWRRSLLETMSTAVRAITLIGAVLVLVFVFSVPPAQTQGFVTAASALVALVALFDLVFGIDSRARLHTDLYRRFKRLQVEMAQNRDRWAEHVSDWRAEAQSIRVDEPPVFWAVYMQGWNQALGKRKVASSHFRRVTPMQGFLGIFLKYRPMDFPLVGP